MIRGGENISVTEVEQVAHQHSAVREVAIFGVPDERLGETLCAMVATEAGQTISEAELRSHLEGYLAAFKVPQHFFIQKEPLLRGATGKLLKRGMREAVIKKMGLST